MKPITPYADLKAPKPVKAKKPLRAKSPKTQGHRFPDLVNNDLRRYVRGLPCLIKGMATVHHGYKHLCVGPTVCAHIKTRGSGGADDNNIVPLCSAAHYAQEGQTKAFEEAYGIDLRATARKVTAKFYDSLGGKVKPT